MRSKNFKALFLHLGFAVLYSGACGTKKCPKICTLQYEPVCAIDKIGNYATFGNDCEFKARNCQSNNGKNINLTTLKKALISFKF